MRIHGGILVHESRDDHGLLQVVDDGLFRSLHFGSEPKQSSMDLHDPWRLALSYTRAMSAGMLFGEKDPERCLVIGLGGGSLAKFLLHHFPDIRVDAVELREQVVSLAHHYFLLPDDPRLTIHVEDAGSFVRRAAPNERRYDLILVDAYEHDGMALSVAGLDFFHALRLLLIPGGVLAVNLWAGDSLPLEDTLGDIGDNFEGRVFTLPVEEKENVIAIAPNTALTRQQHKQLKKRAKQLQRQLNVEYPAFLRILRRHNKKKL